MNHPLRSRTARTLSNTLPHPLTISLRTLIQRSERVVI